MTTQAEILLQQLDRELKRLAARNRTRERALEEAHAEIDFLRGATSGEFDSDETDDGEPESSRYPRAA